MQGLLTIIVSRQLSNVLWDLSEDILYRKGQQLNDTEIQYSDEIIN